MDRRRKPLIVQEARQVGKTWLIREFGKTEFKQTLYVNFEKENRLQDLFLQDLNPKRIIATLEAFFQIKVEAENTLIVFGEIVPIEVKAAENTKAKSFKFFCEKYKPQTAIRTSPTDFRQESWMTNVPLYIIGNYFSEL